MSTEQWADIPGYEGFYQASNLGRIRSLVRMTIDAHLHGERQEKKVLSRGINNLGRSQVLLSKGGVGHRFLVHRLVLAAWVGECPAGYEARHKDKDYRNNRLDNLQWDERSNIRAGENTTQAKLTESAVREIRRREKTQSQLADKFGVSQVTISHIQNRVSWKHVE